MPDHTAVIFDIDGTLLRSSAEDERLYFEAITSVLGKVEVRPDLSDYSNVTDTGILLQILDDNRIDGPNDIVEVVKETFVRLVAARLRTEGPFEEIPGASTALRALRKRADTAVAIATGGWGQTARMKLSAANFDVDGIPLASSDDSHRRVEIMQIARARLPGDARRTVYVGDGSWDRDACAELGWEFVGVGPAVGGVTDLSKLRIP